MLKMSAQRGDVIHIFFADGRNGMIAVQSRSVFAFHFPPDVKITRERRRQEKLINDNQK
ncbi:hypothetical protein Pcaca03_29030 [Pectobacterium carotovorum subsp. carotovorum]|uniref:Uncharacterized protein n=1 Tax=Pectobacterium carotovorum subsp. carotovorum TaxID=555 RepID=A0AAI9PEG0_PECCC|nr:hypothetical protein SOASR016_27670 [Pectobacterium carotovorum subsp. carotovorum]GLV70459.1 hypothetical protein Pcaca03_29030 [Pectobacterium carotovorum subsp. carotovorum]